MILMQNSPLLCLELINLAVVEEVNQWHMSTLIPPAPNTLVIQFAEKDKMSPQREAKCAYIYLTAFYADFCTLIFIGQTKWCDAVVQFWECNAQMSILSLGPTIWGGEGGGVQMCLLIKKLFVMTFSLLFWTNSFIVQLGLGFKLITKLTFNTI